MITRATLTTRAKHHLLRLWPYARPVRKWFRRMRYGLVSPLRRLPFSSAVLGPPKGVVRTTREWFSNRPGSDGGSEFYSIIHSSQPVARKLPVQYDAATLRIFCNARIGRTAETFVAGIENGRFWGNYGGAIITPDDRVLSDLSIDKVSFDAEQHAAFLRFKLPRMTELKGTVACLATPENEHNYYHWLLDFVPRFGLLKHARIQAEEIDWFVVNHDGLKFQVETFQRLGIPEAKLIRSDGRLHFRAARLIVPSPVAPSVSAGEFMVPAWACEFVREVFTKPDRERGNRPARLYIRRGDAAVRRLLNEDELIAALQTRGFTAVSPGGLPVCEQAAMFASAEAVVAPHGAGLANLVFCRPGTKVLEFFSPNYIQEYYWNLSNQVGLQYHCMAGDGAYVEGLSNRFRNQQDIIVDIPRLLRLLDSVFESSDLISDFPPATAGRSGFPLSDN